MSSQSSRALYRREALLQSCTIPEISDDYNLPLHVGALFIILAVSFSACLLPIIVTKVPRLRIPPTFLFVVRHFGTGVLIATAFVHLLPTAFISLNDPCLPAFWNEKYPAIPGAFAMAAIFGIVVVEMTFSPGKNCCAYPATLMERGDGARFSVQGESQEEPSGTEPGVMHGRRGSTARQLQQVTAQSANLDVMERSRLPLALDKEIDSHLDNVSLSATQKHKKDLMQCLLLELGILFHSVFIGMALSVATGNDFIVLLIAISFHQTFEGLALGSRIAALTWQPNAAQPWLMALAYGCTTPIGQAIGLATHTLYSPASQTGLLVVGIMNAISAGLLVWASLVELIMEDFLSDESWKVLQGRRRVLACLLVLAGAFGMALVGAWA